MTTQIWKGAESIVASVHRRRLISYQNSEQGKAERRTGVKVARGSEKSSTDFEDWYLQECRFHRPSNPLHRYVGPGWVV